MTVDSEITCKVETAGTGAFIDHWNFMLLGFLCSLNCVSNQPSLKKCMPSSFLEFFISEICLH